jgi:hypothetical protein
MQAGSGAQETAQLALRTPSPADALRPKMVPGMESDGP